MCSLSFHPLETKMPAKIWNLLEMMHSIRTRPLNILSFSAKGTVCLLVIIQQYLALGYKYLQKEYDEVQTTNCVFGQMNYTNSLINFSSLCVNLHRIAA